MFRSHTHDSGLGALAHFQQLPLPGLGPPGSPFNFLRPLGAVGGVGIGVAVGHGVSPAIRPVIQDLANLAWEAHQVRPLEPSIAAQLVAEELWTEGQGQAEAARSGINGERFAGLVAEARTGPTIEQALVGVRRGILDGGDLTRAMRQAGVRPEWDELLRALLEVLPSVTDAVHFAVREAYDDAASAALDTDAEFPPAFMEAGRKLGLSDESIRRYWRSHWGLPSYEQGVQMLFRGQISPGQFDALLKALDYAPTWRDKLRAIALRIPPLQDMIRFAVRDAYSPATVEQFGLDAEFPDVFAQEAALHGMSAENARLYWRAHWRLPSAMQGYRMLWRGLITEAQLDLLLKTLDYPPFWRGRLAEMAHLVPGRIDLKRMLRHEILDRAEVKAGYQRIGYAEPDAEHMTAIAEAEVGATADESAWAGRARSRLFTVTHNEYLDGSIDAGAASALLGTVGVLAGERQRILTLWNAERKISRLELTPAQIKKAFKAGPPEGYTYEVAVAELVERGMTTDDADTFLTT